MAGHQYVKSTQIKKLYIGDESNEATKISKAYIGSDQVYSGASLVTYNVDSGSSFSEEVDEGLSVLSPSTTPVKTGYTFLGWREDSVASTDVLTNKLASGEPITLYAVFYKTCTVTTYNGDTEPSIDVQDIPYNNGNEGTATYTLGLIDVIGYSKEGWTDNPSSFTKTKNDGSEIVITNDVTYYSLYSKSITLTTYNNSSIPSVESKSQLVRYGSAIGYQNPSFNLSITQRTDGWLNGVWTTDNTDPESGSEYPGIYALTLSEDLTLYSKYSKELSVEYYTSVSDIITKFEDSVMSYLIISQNGGITYNSEYTLSQGNLTGYSKGGFTTDEYGFVAEVYESEPITIVNDTVFYSLYLKTINLTTYNGSSTTSIQTGDFVINVYGTESKPSFTLSESSLTGWTKAGWTSNSSGFVAEYSSSDTIELNADTTLYSLYTQTVYMGWLNLYESSSLITEYGTRTVRYGTSIDYIHPSFSRDLVISPYDWTIVGWGTTDTSRTASYSSGQSVSITSGTGTSASPAMILYAIYNKSHTLTYYNNSSSASSSSGVVYVTSKIGGWVYYRPTVKLTVATVSGWTIRGWSTSSSASASISYSSGADIPVDAGTVYASWSKTVYLYMYNNSSSASSKSGTAYRDYKGSVTNAAIASNAVATVSGWNIRGWSTSSSASASISYSSGATISTSSNLTVYASWSRTVTVSYNGNGQSSGSTAASTGTAYRNYAGTVSAASIALRANGFAKTSCTFYRWALNSASGSQYKAGASISSSTDVTMYANWIATETSFNYTGGTQSFTMLAGVTYLLQVYGAQGGSVSRAYQTAVGGKGAYAYGYKAYSSNTTIYICVGGKGAAGADSGVVAGGYNGGGSSHGDDHTGGGGGGATHIGLSNAILKNTASSNVLIVAGGGGGAGGNQNYGEGAVAAGGGGGGTTGSAGSIKQVYSGGATAGQGGTQSGAGSGSPYQTAGGYGQGASYNPTYYSLAGGAGGGGWYGGGMGYGSQYEDQVNAGGGGGGSGYIGGVSNGGFQNGYWPDNGFAKITVSSVA